MDGSEHAERSESRAVPLRKPLAAYETPHAAARRNRLLPDCRLALAVARVGALQNARPASVTLSWRDFACAESFPLTPAVSVFVQGGFVPSAVTTSVRGTGVISTATVKGAREGARVEIMPAGGPRTAVRVSRSAQASVPTELRASGSTV